LPARRGGSASHITSGTGPRTETGPISCRIGPISHYRDLG
jgi:hypothetical protein